MQLGWLYCCFFLLLHLTVFTKDSIKEDECSGYRAATLVYAFVCLCAWHSWFKGIDVRETEIVIYYTFKA